MGDVVREEIDVINTPIFQNYHRHSTYTNVKVADSVVTNEDYARRAAELGHGIISSCEHGYQGRYIEAHRLAKQYGLKFLCSAEAYWVWDRHETDRSNCHIWIGAKNEDGREWLNEVLSQANETGFYGQPRLDPELIDLLPAGDVWITSACIGGWKYREQDESRLLDFFRGLYEKHGDNFMFEVQYHNTPSQKELNSYILKVRNQIPAPIIMGCDSHYIAANGGQDRTDFLTSKEMNYPEEDGWFMDYPAGDEAVRRFQAQGILSAEEIRQAIDQTNCFLSVEEYDCDIFDDSVKLFSLYPDKPQEEKDRIYEELVWDSWEQEKPKIATADVGTYVEEIYKEVSTVKECGMSDYFIDNYHIIKRGKELGGHLTSTGRGSAVSFYTNKLLGFTEVDRIAAKVHMYPERFMTAERILETHSIPDIDFNVAEQDIFAQAQADVCGADHAVQMIAYGTQKKSAAWKMFAKSQGIDFETSNRVSSQLKRYEDRLKHANEDEKDDIDVFDFIDREFHDIYRKSESYQGIIVSWSPAPCAFLLYQGSIRRKIGLVKIKDRMCCLMDGHWAEENHFLKNDLLRVAVVDLISRGYERAGIPLPNVTQLLEMCPPEDPCWDIYRKGCTVGINQVEQPGTSSRVGVYAPSNISELCAFVAAIRPGFKSMYKTFESRQDFSYGVKSFDELLRTEEMPQSFCLYQEQQMAALNFAGFPMPECYAAIKNIAKKRSEKVLAYKDRFLKGFAAALREAEHISESEADEKSQMVWQIIEDSARYSFNCCVTGDTVIEGTGMTVQKMADKDRIEARGLSMKSDLIIAPNDIIGVTYAGHRDVLRITTVVGKKIDCTPNHKFPTPEGEKMAGELSEKDYIYVTEHGFVHPVLIRRIEKCEAQDVYDVEMAAPYHNFVLENGIVTSNSHSYCVSLDSLYGAWLKAHYPLAFYETYMRIMDDKGNKEKLAAARDEAMDYFNIHFPPFRFGQDNRDIVADAEHNAINNALGSIKGFSRTVAETLYEAGQQGFTYLTDVLLFLRQHSFKQAISEPLAKISYFQRFGNDREVLNIISLVDEFKYGETASYSRDRIDGTFMEQIVSPYANGNKKDGTPATRYTLVSPTLDRLKDEKKAVNKRIKQGDEAALADLDVIEQQIMDETVRINTEILHRCEEKILSSGISDLSFRLKIQNQEEILGSIDLTTGREEDRRLIIISKLVPLLSKDTGKPWGYALFTQSLGSGKKARLTLRSRLFDQIPIREHSIIFADAVSKNRSGYWYLDQYHIVDF